MTYRFLLPIGASAALLLSGCFWDAPADGGASSSSSSFSSSSSAAAAVPVRGRSDVGEFKKQADGSYLGSVTVTGYAVTKDVRQFFCESNCKTFRYVSFHITDGMTPDLASFLGMNEDDAFSSKDSIGIGCVTEGGAIRSDLADPETYMSSRQLDAKDAQVILSSNPRNLVTVTFDRPYEPAGGEAPNCYAHFGIEMVTD